MIFGLPDYINLFLRNDNMFGYDLGIDFGTSSLVISVPGKGVVVNEPSYVAYDTETETMLAEELIILRGASRAEFPLFSR